MRASSSYDPVVTSPRNHVLPKELAIAAMPRCTRQLLEIFGSSFEPKAKLRCIMLPTLNTRLQNVVS